MKKAILLLMLLIGAGSAYSLGPSWEPPRIPLPPPPPPPPPRPVPWPGPGPIEPPPPPPNPGPEPHARPADPLPQAAPAEQPDSSVTFRMQSDYVNIVRLRFFSQRRSGWSWPGGEGYYVLKDYDFHDFTLNCMSGEKICYGAWAIDGTNYHWGSGANDSFSCTHCCALCGGDVSVHSLER